MVNDKPEDIGGGAFSDDNAIECQRVISALYIVGYIITWHLCGKNAAYHLKPWPEYCPSLAAFGLGVQCCLTRPSNIPSITSLMMDNRLMR